MRFDYRDLQLKMIATTMNYTLEIGNADIMMMMKMMMMIMVIVIMT